VTDVFIYGFDEAIGAQLVTQRDAWGAAHDAGAEVFLAGFAAAANPPGNFAVMGDIQDLFICAHEPGADEAAKWHGVQHRVFNYWNPFVCNEQPEIYRRNHGLLLWQQDYDGAMDYAYQDSGGSTWNDFDHSPTRDIAFA